MKNLFRLAYVIFRGNGMANFAGDAGRRKKKLSTVGSVVLFAFLAIYMIAVMTGAAVTFYDLLTPVGLQGMLVSLFLSTGVMLVFLFGVLYVISIFYYASDVEKILPLPLRADDVIGAKLLVTAVYEYIFLLILVVPALAVYGIRSGAGPLYYLYAVITVVVLPVVPLCMSAVLVMIIMRFTPFARNKDRFSMAANLLAMGLALAVVFGSQSMVSLSEKDLANLIGGSASNVARLTSAIFPGTSLAAMALANPSGWSAAGQIGLLVLIAAAALVITMQLSRLLYFKGVIGISASASGRRKLTAREMADAGTSGSAFWTYVLKDVRVLLRTPIFFMNNVLMNFLWPVFVLIPLMSGDQGDGIGQALKALRASAFGPDSGAALTLAIAFGATCFITGTNGIAESALSREGKLLYIMKILPMSYVKQLWAKVTVGILMSLCGCLLLVVIFIAMIQPPIWFILLMLAMIPGATLLLNLTGLVFDLYWPKLNWENEQKAVKQNLNVVYGILLSLFLAAAVIAPVVAFRLTLVPAALLVCGAPLLLALAAAALIRRIGPRQMLSFDV